MNYAFLDANFDWKKCKQLGGDRMRIGVSIGCSSREFFSRYSTILIILLKVRRILERPMRVTQWNQYQLVDKEVDPDIQLASGNNRLVCGCTFFVCFRRPSVRRESPCHLKVGPVQNHEVLPGPAVFCESKDLPRSDDGADDGDVSSIREIISLKSSLKKPLDLSLAATGGGGCTKDHMTFCEKNGDAARRKVQWTDTSGGELYQVREFEMSESGSDDEFYRCNKKACSCNIM